MATFLDLSFFQGLTPIFVFFLIFGIVYALLQGLKVLGSNKAIHAIIAIVIGILLAINIKSTQVIAGVIPWFTIVIIFFILAAIAGAAFGMNPESIVETIGGSTLRWTVIILAAIIVISVLGSVYGQSNLAVTGSGPSNVTAANGASGAVNATSAANGNLNTDTGNFNENLAATFFHPRVLGFILVILIATMTVVVLAK